MDAAGELQIESKSESEGERKHARQTEPTMKPKTFMLIAGEPSGDLLAAELIHALRAEFAAAAPVFTTDYQPLPAALEPCFIGAGGPLMAKAGVRLACDLTEHSVIGFSDVVRNILKFRRLLRRLYDLALEHQPDAIVCVDFSGFNRRLAHAVKTYVRKRLDWFHDWDPRIVQYVSPQVWASREGRARQMAYDYDLLLSIFPFERDWYAKHVPKLRVEFVGHPIVDRYGALPTEPRRADLTPGVVLLPGSRPAELARHIPVMLRAFELLGADASIAPAAPKLRALMVMPNEPLAQMARSFQPPDSVSIQVGDLATALSAARLAIACTGTVTMECAWFGVSTVALYKTSWTTYQVAKRLVKVPYLAMPNLLAGEELFPEFIQTSATAENIAQAARVLLRDDARRARIKTKLAEIIASLGPPGAARRAAGYLRAVLYR